MHGKTNDLTTMNKKLFLLLAFCSAIFAVSLKAQQVQKAMPSITGSIFVHSGEPIQITGTAAPGSEIVVVLNRMREKVMADIAGNWKATFPELKTTEKPATLKVGCADSSIEYKGIIYNGMQISLGNAAKTSVSGIPTIFSIGDSTMANKKEGTEEAGWCQLLHEHLTDAIRVDNHAQNGRSSKSFIDEGRWQKVVDLLQPGDYVFIQFGHNDEKADEKRHTDANTTFKDNLRKFITEAEDKGAIPVLFNSMVRRKFEGDKLINTHGDYIKAPFEVAEEMGVPCIDAEALSKKLVESLGPEDSKKLFMWFPPEKQDDTHLNHYGARQMSKLFLDALAERLPSFKQYMK